MTRLLTNAERAAIIADKKAPRVTAEYMLKRISFVEYQRLGKTMTLCIMTLDNGYTVRGESACVSLENYDQLLGENYAYDDAFKKLWPLFGFLLAENLYLGRLKNGHN